MAERNSLLEYHYGWAAETLDGLCRLSPDLMHAVYCGGPSTVQVIAAVLSSPTIEAEVHADPAQWADRLAHAPRIELLRQAFGRVPEGFQSALAKFGRRVVPRPCYAALHRAFAHPTFGRVIVRRRRISAGLLTLFGAPEAELLHRKLLMRLKCTKTEPMTALIEAIALRRRTPPWSEHLDELKACTKPIELLRWLQYRFERPFPPPPWPGDDLLEPITDAATLRRVGRDMQNCLADDSLEVGRGAHYYYVTRRKPQVAVGVELRVKRWHVTQIQRENNQRPKPAVRREVIERLLKAGFAIDLDDETYSLVEMALGIEGPVFLDGAGIRELR